MPAFDLKELSCTSGPGRAALWGAAINISSPAVTTAVSAREEGGGGGGERDSNRKRPTTVCPPQDQLGLFTQAPPDCVYG